MMLYEDLTNKILASCFEVSNELGPGFLESVYSNALLIALKEKGLHAEQEYPLAVSFRGKNVGQFYVDLLVENKLLLN